MPKNPWAIHFDNTDLPAEIDFAKGERGKFYRKGTCLHLPAPACTCLHLPVYLDDPVQDRLAAIADATGVELSALVNDLLRRDLERIEAAR